MGLVLPRHFFYAVIVFTILVSGIVGTISLVQEGESGNPTTAVPNLMATSDIGASEFNKTFYPKEFENRTAILQQKISALEVDAGSGIVTTSLALISTAWESVRFIFGSLGVMNKSLKGLSAILGVPIWVPALLSLIIVILFIFSIITIIFGKES